MITQYAMFSLHMCLALDKEHGPSPKRCKQVLPPFPQMAASGRHNTCPGLSLACAELLVLKRLNSSKQHVFKSEVENACEVVIMATTACLGLLKTLNV